MTRRFRIAAAIALLSVAMHAGAGESTEHRVTGRPATPGYAFGYAADMLRTRGGEELADMTVASIFTARNAAGVHQWAFGIASEAWALPGSRSLLVGIEAAVVNEEPTNLHPKVAVSAIMKNRADLAPARDAPANANSIGVLVSAQPGTGFERGVVFDRDSLVAVGRRPAAIDLSDLPDAAIGEIDLIRIRKGVSLRYDPASGQLVLHRDLAPQPSGL